MLTKRVHKYKIPSNSPAGLFIFMEIPKNLGTKTIQQIDIVPVNGSISLEYFLMRVPRGFRFRRNPYIPNLGRCRLVGIDIKTDEWSAFISRKGLGVDYIDPSKDSEHVMIWPVDNTEPLILSLNKRVSIIRYFAKSYWQNNFIPSRSFPILSNTGTFWLTLS